MKLFIDNDVILDVILHRPGYHESEMLLGLVEISQVLGVTSPIIFTNSFYIISRLKDKKSAWQGIKKIRLLLSVAPVTEPLVDQALASDFEDFEDAIQYFTALKEKVDFLITRNKKHYQSAQIPVLTPAEFMALQARGVGEVGIVG